MSLITMVCLGAWFTFIGLLIWHLWDARKGE